MNIHYLTSGEKKRLLAYLEGQFGITKLPYLLIQTGKEKIRGFSGSFSKDEIHVLGSIANVEIIGIYLCKEEHDLRLSFDASLLLKDQITKGFIAINDAQADEWMRGNDLDIAAPAGTIVMKHHTDFLGCGRSTGTRIVNYVPKDRRLKSRKSMRYSGGLK